MVCRRKRDNWRCLVPLLALILILGVFSSPAVAAAGVIRNTSSGGTAEMLTPPVPEGFFPFIRIDRDSTKAWKKELGNLRLITKGRYSLKQTEKSIAGKAPGYLPDSTGMDSLNISGSAQFSTEQFRELADTLRDCAGEKEIWIIDLRRESHAMLNDISYSWYEAGNWSNIGLTAEEIEADQDSRFGSLVGKTVTAFKQKKKMPKDDGFAVTVESYLAEKELVEEEGFHYLRIPVLDFSWPKPEEADAFIRFVRELDMDDVWLHFHCQAGKGRTGEFMIMYDKMKNPEVAMEDIVIRQTILGGTSPLSSKTGEDFQSRLAAEKDRMMRLFFRYVEENRSSNYEMLWSEWIRTQAG